MAIDTLERFRESHSVGRIDREKGIIYGVSVITGDREASGHEMYVDQVMVEQVYQAGLSAGDVGVKARFDHPNPCSNSMGTELGRFRNFSLDGNQVRADLHLNDASAISPNGNYRDYVLSLAEEDPEQFATSIVFRMAESYMPQKEDYPDQDPSDDNPFWFEHARVKSMTHVDVVNEGAANDGLFSNKVEMAYMALKAKQFITDNKEILKPALSELVGEIIKENPQTHTQMESKNFFERLFSSKSKEEVEEVANEVTAELSSKESEVAELSSKIEELTASIEEQKENFEAVKTSLTEKNEKLAAELSAAIQERDQLSAKIESKIEIEEGEDKTPDLIEQEEQLSEGAKIIKGVFEDMTPAEKLAARKKAAQNK